MLNCASGEQLSSSWRLLIWARVGHRFRAVHTRSRVQLLPVVGALASVCCSMGELRSTPFAAIAGGTGHLPSLETGKADGRQATARRCQYHQGPVSQRRHDIDALKTPPAANGTALRTPSGTQLQHRRVGACVGDRCRVVFSAPGRWITDVYLLRASRPGSSRRVLRDAECTSDAYHCFGSLSTLGRL
jgi:hypothetical protein